MLFLSFGGGMMEAQVTSWGNAMMASVAGALAMFFAAIPKIIGFAVILIIGWFVASLIEKALSSVLHVVRFNSLADRAGLTDFVKKADSNTDASGMIASIAKWFIRLIALVVAFDELGLPAVSDILRQLLLWLPNLVVALVALVIGGLAANALGNLVRGVAAEGRLERPELLGKIAKVAVWAFAIVVAVNQIGVATALVNTLFMATVGAVALALGLSFGLGGRETAGEVVRKWYAKGRDKTPQIERAATAATMSINDNSGMAAAHGERRMGATDRRRFNRGPSIVR
jgi:hypothetical protein